MADETVEPNVEEVEAGVPSDLIDLYIDLEPEAERRGITVEELAAELKQLAGGGE